MASCEDLPGVGFHLKRGDAQTILMSTSFRQFGFALVGLVALATGRAGEARVRTDVPYREAAPGVAAPERCRLDLYLPATEENFPTLVWLHGGGLTGGSKSTEVGKRVAQRLAERGIAVAMVGYRLNPAVKFPGYVDDAATALAWVRANIAPHGGDPARVVLGGHSAGAYLALMVALDDRFLRAHGLEPSALAGVVALSSQMSTHFTVREERGVDARLVVDDAAPLFHAGRRPFPFLVLYAGEDLPLRAEENRLFAQALREAGTAVEERSFDGRAHNTIYSKMGDPDDAVATLIARFVKNARR